MVRRLSLKRCARLLFSVMIRNRFLGGFPGPGLPRRRGPLPMPCALDRFPRLVALLLFDSFAAFLQRCLLGLHTLTRLPIQIHLILFWMNFYWDYILQSRSCIGHNIDKTRLLRLLQHSMILQLQT